MPYLVYYDVETKMKVIMCEWHLWMEILEVYDNQLGNKNWNKIYSSKSDLNYLWTII